MAKLKADVNEYRKELSQDIAYYRKKMAVTNDEYAAEALDCLLEEYNALVKNPDNYEV